MCNIGNQLEAMYIDILEMSIHIQYIMAQFKSFFFIGYAHSLQDMCALIQCIFILLHFSLRTTET